MTSRRLVLIRHAEAEDKGGAPDFDRMLTANGRDHAARLGGALHRLGIRVERMVASPAPRAIETARLCCTGLGIAPSQIREDRDLYNAMVRKLLPTIARQGAGLTSLALVGHNIGLTELTASLAALDPDWSLEKGHAVVLETSAPWSELDPGSCRLVHQVQP